jgi:SAM-dependent methyltransferase
MMKRSVLNVGGNNKAIPIPDYYAGFEHLLLDIDPRGKPDVLCDARELATLEAGRFDAIYCSHNLEHYFPHDVPRVLAGFKHVLSSDGFAEIRVPDLDDVIKTYVAKKMDIDDVLYESGMGPILVRDVFYGYHKEIQSSGQDFFAHKTGFTHKSLTKALIGAGFQYVMRRPGRGYELLCYGFKQKPTAFQQELLKFDFEKLSQRQST